LIGTAMANSSLALFVSAFASQQSRFTLSVARQNLC
jgi:hypothetical protein